MDREEGQEKKKKKGIWNEERKMAWSREKQNDGWIVSGCGTSSDGVARLAWKGEAAAADGLPRRWRRDGADGRWQSQKREVGKEGETVAFGGCIDGSCC